MELVHALRAADHEFDHMYLGGGLGATYDDDTDEAARAGVGQNLQDHPSRYPRYLSKRKVSPIRYQRLDRKGLVDLQWLLTRLGKGATNHMEGAALLRAGPESPYPD
ncbi:MAG TPA: hypothetical protein ENK83_05020, partial [Aliiroseovarius sp.]|nr:hypothetical protein [Aliiroseovarius sp.]